MANNKSNKAVKAKKNTSSNMKIYELMLLEFELAYNLGPKLTKSQLEKLKKQFLSTVQA
ncbi:MAG: hypothetical protein OHK0017_09180 [Patescibacteria group bacterium]